MSAVSVLNEAKVKLYQMRQGKTVITNDAELVLISHLSVGVSLRMVPNPVRADEQYFAWIEA
jgi:hypothetical protein